MQKLLKTISSAFSSLFTRTGVFGPAPPPPIDIASEGHSHPLPKTHHPPPPPPPSSSFIKSSAVTTPVPSLGQKLRMFEKPGSLISGNSKPVMDVRKSQSVQQLIQASERRERGDTGNDRVPNTYIFRPSFIPRLSICSMKWS